MKINKMVFLTMVAAGLCAVPPSGAIVHDAHSTDVAKQRINAPASLELAKQRINRPTNIG